MIIKKKTLVVKKINKREMGNIALTPEGSDAMLAYTRKTFAADASCNDAFVLHLSDLLREYATAIQQQQKLVPVFAIPASLYVRINSALDLVRTSCMGEVQRNLLLYFLDIVGYHQPSYTEDHHPLSTTLLEQEHTQVKLFGKLTSVIGMVLRWVPTSCLLAVADMRRHMRNFLIDLGRPEEHGDWKAIPKKKLKEDLADPSAADWIKNARRLLLFDDNKDRLEIHFLGGTCNNTFLLTYDQAHDMMSGSALVLGMWDALPDNGLRTALISGERPMDRFDPDCYLISQTVVFEGPIYVIFDAHGQTQERSQTPVHCVTVPLLDVHDPRSPDAVHVQQIDQHGMGLVIKPDSQQYLLQRMRISWFLVLDSFNQRNIKYPILSAMECDRFQRCPVVSDLDSMWAHALCQVLTRIKQSTAYVTVFVTVTHKPTFDAFSAIFDQWRDRFPCPVLLLNNRSALDIANYLSVNLRACVGVMNPTDTASVITGQIGMEWDTECIRSEDLLALRTTLCLLHRDVAPMLYDGDIPPRECILDPTVVDVHWVSSEPILYKGEDHVASDRGMEEDV